MIFSLFALVPNLWASEFQIHVLASSFQETYFQAQTSEVKKIPVCSPIGEQLLGCVWGRKSNAEPFALVHLNEVSSFSQSRDSLWEEAKSQLKVEVNPKRYQNTKIAETNYSYWVSNQYDGYDAAALIHPSLLSSFLTDDILMSIPAQGTVIFWENSTPEQNKIIAVGIHDLFEASEVPVSPNIYQWDGDRWVVWARAKVKDK
jgi:hypothetical protein